MKTFVLQPFNSNSPQGDGNLKGDHKVFNFLLLSTPTPRKGTETVPGGVLALNNPWNLSTPTPRKGTETKYRHRREGWLGTYPFNSNSPQGDGNTAALVQTPSTDPTLSTPTPRKGTETLPELCSSFLLFVLSFNSNSPQGDGNLPPDRVSYLISPLSFNSNSPQGDGNVTVDSLPSAV